MLTKSILGDDEEKKTKWENDLLAIQRISLNNLHFMKAFIIIILFCQ